MRLRIGICLLVIAVVGCVATLPVSADEDAPPQTYARGVTRKLGRGIANVFTAPLELLRVPSLTSQREGGVAGLSVGVVHGAWAAVVRELAGITEIVMCPIPIPKNFEPLVYPEFIYAHGDWVP